MIRLEKTGDCIDCPGIDLTIGTLYLGTQKIQTVICKNEKLCRRLKKAWEEREKEEQG